MKLITTMRSWKTYWIISLILIPLSIISYAYFGLTLIFGDLFTTNIELLNSTRSEIKVTLFGSFGDQENYPIPVYGKYGFEALKSKRIRICPNESKKLRYDYDDYFVHGIIIEGDKTVRIMLINDLKEGYSKIDIKNIEHLSKLDKSMYDKIFGKKNYINLIYGVLLLGIINPFLVVFFRRRMKINTAHNN